ncbi:hypothetical protein AAFF_G00333730 [Aldrovandia affinis]|uniref:Myotubularin phosphatase domain-containing protein n=1 Tax=Aldrovandia affinis TaxID=143900 RepID=A0AAD7R715_9TELE|nr:hypothetical protein AAFF_G00333730 [Aldrovandia affinis]
MVIMPNCELEMYKPEDRDVACVVCGLVQVMSDPHCRTQPGFQGLVQKEWVTAGHRFLSRANYYHDRDRDREEAPVFLLFLDCVWQLWTQFSSYFQLTEEYLLALQESTHLPLHCSFLYDCERERSRRSQHLTQSYTPINGWREGLAGDPTPYPMDPPLPPVWDWALWYSSERRDRFTHSMATPASPLPVLNGKLSPSQSAGGPGQVFLLSRGSFSSPSLLLPWRGGGGGGGAASGPGRRSHRHGPPAESPAHLQHLLRGVATGPSGPQEPLLPLLFSPCVGLWRACYLRGALQAQAFSHPRPASGHPVDILAREVEQLRERLRERLASVGNGTAAAEQESHDRDAGLLLVSEPQLLEEAIGDPPPNFTLAQHTALFSPA